MKKILLSVFVLALAVMFTVTISNSSFAAEKKAKKLEKVSVGASPLVPWIAVFAAKEKGYLEEEGLDVDIKIFKDSTKDILPLVASSNLDVGYCGLNAGFYNALLQGVEVKLVSGPGQVGGMQGVLISKSQFSGTKEELTKEILQGKTFGILVKGYPQEITLDIFLKKYGLTVKDVNITTMSWPSLNAALANGSIFGAVQFEPFLSIARKDGIAIEVANGKELYPDIQGGAVLYSEKFVKNKKAGMKFMKAFIRGTRYLNDWKNGKGNDEEFYAIVKKYLTMDKPEILKTMDMGIMALDGELNVAGMQDDLVWYKDHGYIEKIPPMSDIVDQSFVEKAIKAIGKFKK